MKITKETIEHVTRLAKLEFTEAEKEKILNELENILLYMKKINEVDTTNVKPMEHVMPTASVLREDNAGKSYEREDILANAPSVMNGYFKVPKAFE
ncbi:MAG TPA: Asp-tRNA(Asn)/Glu-tRNA(Gln) amidotransferase subunit GatC [Clostridiaceae bacterium]|nr:Asp-tRNA(Asn)/Glu-tRNA(Gln) amidotransferase subunit GatC [Clostridiaceae bacterium]